MTRRQRPIVEELATRRIGNLDHDAQAEARQADSRAASLIGRPHHSREVGEPRRFPVSPRAACISKRRVRH